MAETKQGGAVLGKGAKGITIDVHSQVKSDIHTLYHHVLGAASVHTYSINKPKPLIYEDAESITRFANVLINKPLVAKSFQNEDDFKREVVVYGKLLDVYGKSALLRYTASANVLFNQQEVVAIKITHKTRKAPTFYILNSKCSKSLDSFQFTRRIDVVNMILQVLASINTLQSMNFGHFDIKPDNIMVCSRTTTSTTLTPSSAIHFKLIDWDLAHELAYDKRYYASRSFTSPIAWKLTWNSVGNLVTLGQPQKMAKLGTMTALARRQYADVFQKHPIMPALLAEVEEHYAQIFANYRATENRRLFDDYKETIDLYNFGMTVIYIVLRNRLEGECADIIDFAKQLLLSKIPNAAEALRLALGLTKRSSIRRSSKKPSKSIPSHDR